MLTCYCEDCIYNDNYYCTIADLIFIEFDGSCSSHASTDISIPKEE